jgi:hypothetical protein
VEDEGRHRLVVERLLAGVTLRAHRHEGGGREDRHEEGSRPGADGEGQHRERRAGDGRDQPGAADLGLDEEAAQLRPELRTRVDGGVEGVDEGEEAGGGSRDGEDGG